MCALVRSVVLWSTLTSVATAGPAAAGAVPFGPATPVGTLPGLLITAVAAADLDGDGHLDAVGSSVGDADATPPVVGRLAWHPNPTGDGGFGPASVVQAGLARFGGRVADVDDDTDSDLVFSDILFGTVDWSENAGDGSSYTLRTAASGFGAWVVDAADLDGDDDTDLVSAGSFIRWHESDGATPPGFTTYLVSGSDNWHDVVPADLDGDGDVDLLAVTGGQPPPFMEPGDEQPIRVVWLESDGMSPPAYTSHPIDSTTPICPSERLNPPCMRVHAGDVDGDGHLDAVVGSAAGLASWYESDGADPLGFTAHPVGTAAPATPVDVDGDGDLDLVSALNELAWLENDGASPPGWTVHDVAVLADPPLIPPRPVDVAAADFDGDGDPDLLVGVGLDLVWFENQRGSPAAVPALGVLALAVLAALLIASRAPWPGVWPPGKRGRTLAAPPRRPAVRGE